MKFFVSFIVILSCLLFQIDSWAFSRGVLRGERTSQADCVNAWRGSSASGSCPKTNYNYVNPNGTCYVDTDCWRQGQGSTQNNKYTGSAAQLRSLHNCNGALRSGGC